MTKEAVKNALATQPFKAFALRLTDGTQVPVPHPDFIALSEGGRTAIVITHGEDFKILNLGLVTALESVVTT